jgi:hypothetical protein
MASVVGLARKAAAGGAMIAALGLAGCSVYHAETDGGFSSSALATAKDLPIQVDGVVGGVRGDPLGQAVAAAMPTDVGGAALTYAPCTAYTECPGDHLVWTFGPPAARPTSAYPPALGTNVNWVGTWTPAPTNVTVKVALFQNGNVVSSAAGQVDAASPDDPAFKSLIASMTSTVLSPSYWPGWIF